MRGDNDSIFYIGTFSNGYIIDLFTEQKQAKEILDKMFQQEFFVSKSIEYKEKNNPLFDDNLKIRDKNYKRTIELRISKSNHLYVFAEI